MHTHTKLYLTVCNLFCHFQFKTQVKSQGFTYTVTQDQLLCNYSSVQFSHSVMSDSLRPHGLEHARLPCPSPSPKSCSHSCPPSQWCHPTISSSVISFASYLQSIPASGSFLMSQFFAAGGQILELQHQSSLECVCVCVCVCLCVCVSVCVCMCVLVTQSCLTISGTRTTVACQAPLSMGFSRQEYWSGLPLFSRASQWIFRVDFL